MTIDTDEVRKIVSKILKTSSVTISPVDDLVEKYGMDSMQRVEIVIELERYFDVTIADEQSVKIRSIDSIIELLQALKK